MLSCRSLGLSAAIVLLGSAGLNAADWKNKPFTQWNEDTAGRVVTDSPWARQTRVLLTWHEREQTDITYKDIVGADPNPSRNSGGPLGGIGPRKPKMPTDADIIIRWASALPVRHAKAVYRMQEASGDTSKLNALIEQPSPDYVLEIFGVPAEVAHLGVESVSAVAKQSVTLKTSTGKVLRPSQAETKLNGLTLTIFVHFPRTQELTAADGDVECSGDFQIFHFKERFRLSSMKYMNHLEL